MKPPLKPDGQWPRTIAKKKVVFVMGLKIMTKSKNWQFFHGNHELGKVVEMKGTDCSFVPVGFSRTGTERFKNRSGKCEGSTG